MSERSRTDALAWIAWSRIWSPVVPDALREEAWRALALPDSIAFHDAEFWSTFQLGAACEAYACAVEREDSVLIEELRRRYLLPWCDVAKEALDDGSSRLAFLPERFEADLLELPTYPGVLEEAK